METTSQIFNQVIELLSNVNKSTFVRLNNYENNKGEVSNYTIIANFSYGKAVDLDIEKLSKYTPKNDSERLAKDSLLNSLIKNKDKETASNQSLAQTNAYVNVTNCIRLHIESNSLKMYCKAFSKEVVKPVEYKETKSNELTIAKNKLAKKLKLKHTQYRQFTINKINSIKTNGRLIEID
jgi:phosphoribosylformylglycinamidine (FGAM) synthase PurS component